MKSYLKSKTFWLGLITMILPWVDLINAVLKEYSKLASTILGIIIIVLRFLTKESLAIKTNKEGIK